MNKIIIPLCVLLAAVVAYRFRFSLAYGFYSTPIGTRLVYSLAVREKKKTADGGKRQARTVHDSNTTLVLQLPVLSDNFCYIIHDKESKTCAIVDCVEPDRVVAAIGRDYKIAAILSTHWHHDHAGGNNELVASLLSTGHHGVKVYGSAVDRPQGLTHLVADGDVVTVGAQTTLDVIATPGHTLGSVCYYLNKTMLFTGDTLFTAGCGKLFEGTAEMMYKSFRKIRALPDRTLLAAGHAYCLSNLRFALSLDPANPHLADTCGAAEKTFEQGYALTPTTLEFEHKVNVFLQADSVARFAELRARKDAF